MVVRLQRRAYPPSGRSRRWTPMLHLLHDVLAQAAFDQSQNASVADLLRHPRHEPVVRDRVEIALQVGVDHLDIAGPQQSIDLPQRVLAASAGPEAIAAGPKLG